MCIKYNIYTKLKNFELIKYKNHEDAEEIPSIRKRGTNKICEEKQTYYKDKQLFRCKRVCP
jgi:hypothetical protein